MTDDLIEQLRARNPVPAPLPAPPIDGVLARIAAGERPSGPRWPQWVVPSVAVVVTVAVAAVALVSLHGGHHAAGTADHAARHGTTTVLPTRPIQAMRGSLSEPVLGFGPAGTGVIAWAQIRTANTAHPSFWLAHTSDGGRSWSIERRGYSLFANPVFDSQRDGWTQAVDAHGGLRFYVTHDGGRSWAPVPSAAAADSVDGDVSVAGGVVWTVGTGSCPTASCRWLVMRGPASGDRLPATAAQPLPATNQNDTTISASTATTAYVTSPDGNRSVIYATHDGGRHWQRIRDRCAGTGAGLAASAAGPDSLWRLCGHAPRLVERSIDGGARWSVRQLPFTELGAFEPISSQVAWAQDIHGTIYRTADGGATWQPVWRSGGPHGPSNHGVSPILSAQSATDASLLVQLTHGPISRDRVPHSTSLIVYRTSNAGHSWYPSIVKLPPG